MNRTRNKKQAGWIVGALASASLALGCGGPQGAEQVGPLERPSADNDGIAELTQPLATPSGGSCRWFATADASASPAAIKGELRVTIDANETFVLSKHALNGNVLLNGFEKTCYAGATGTTITSVKASDVKAVTAGEASGATTLVLDFANGTFGAAVTGTTGSGVTVASGIDNVKIRTGSAGDKVYFGVDATPTKLGDFDGKSPADITFAGTPAITVNTGSGADTVDAAGSTTIFGTGAAAFSAALTIYGAADADTLTGGAGADNLYGGAGADTIRGGAGNDKIWGGQGADTLYGQGGNDYVVGEEGSDTINEGADGDQTVSGTDRLYGWLNNDQDGDGIDDTQEATALPPIVSTSGTALGSEPASDVDTITYAGRTVAVVVSPGTATAAAARTTYDVNPCASAAFCFVNSPTTSEFAADGNDGESGERDMVRGDFEIVIGSDQNDTFYSGPGNETLQGGSGNDTFFATRDATAADGSDVFTGGAGDDTVSYRARSTAVCVSIAASTSTTADKNDGAASTCSGSQSVVSGVLTFTQTVTSTENDDVQSDIEIVEGGAGADVLVGNGSNNVLRGGAGADTLAGQGGDDTFDEAYGMGADHTTANTANGADFFYGGTGVDTVSYASNCTGCYGTSRSVAICATIPLSTDDTGSANSGEGGTVNDNGTVAVTCTGVTENDTIKRDVEGVVGGSAADYLVGNDLDNVLDGQGGTDLVLCGLGEGDIAYSGTDLGFDNINQASAKDLNACEL